VGDLEAELVVEFLVLVECISPLLVLECELARQGRMGEES